MSNVRRIFSTTSEVLGSLVATATPAIATLLGQQTIQEAHNLTATTPEDAALKQKIEKDVSMLVSITNSLVVSHQLYTFITRAIAANVWKDLTTVEKISLSILLAAGATSAGYSFWKFGEPQTYAGGFAAATGTLFFGVATNIVNHAKRRQDANANNIYDSAVYRDSPSYNTFGKY